MRFVLPTIIQNRRIYFLDLSDVELVRPENYVISVSRESDIVHLLSIDCKRKLQSLIEGVADSSIASLGYDMSVQEGGLHIQLLDNSSDIEEKQSVENTDVVDWKTASDPVVNTHTESPISKYQNIDGAKIYFKKSNDRLELFAAIEDVDIFLQNNKKLVLTISYTYENKDYIGTMNLYMAPARQFVHSVLDFGSEASQIKHKYTRSSMGVETTESSQENLFLLLKNYQNKKEKADEYLQYSSGDNYLKSIFYIKEDIGGYNPMGEDFFLPTDDQQVCMLCTRSEISSIDFDRAYLQLPNLKLAHRHGSNLSSLVFKYEYSGVERMVEFEHLKEQIYATLLREMSLAYLDNPMLNSSGLFLRYSILIPNIYDHADLIKTKNIIHKILQEAQHNPALPSIECWEIQTLSESDASFLGYYNSLTQFSEPNKNYIVIDCGKGTTDFSILRTHAHHAHEVSPVYRNGFAGAGNLLSYGYFQSMLSFLIQEAPERTEAKNFYEQMMRDLSDSQSQELFEIIEKWKFSYNKSFSQTEIAHSWRTVSDGDINIRNLYKQTDKDYNRVLLFLSKLRVCYDWGGHITDAVNYIADNIATSLETVLTRLEDKSDSVERVLFTGRAFLYSPLYAQVVTKLEAIGIPKTKVEELLNAEKLKSICLDGVIQDGSIIHPEMIGIPIQVELENSVSSDDEYMPKPTKRNLMDNIKRMALKFVDGSGSFDSLQNELKVKTENLKKSKFLMSNSFYSFAHPFFTDSDNYAEVDFIFTNSGFYFRAKDAEDRILLTSKLGEPEEFTSVDKAHVLASLFPATIDPQIVKPFHEDYSETSDDFESFLPKP